MSFWVKIVDMDFCWVATDLADVFDTINSQFFSTIFLWPGTLKGIPNFWDLRIKDPGPLKT